MLVVVVEDDLELRSLMLDVFRDAGCETEAFGDGAAALEFLKRKRPASDVLLITDLMMPGMDGVELLRRLAGERIRIPTVVVSGYLTDKVRARMNRLGAMAVLSKPVDIAVLKGFVKQAASFEPPALSVLPPPEPEAEPEEEHAAVATESDDHADAPEPESAPAPEVAGDEAAGAGGEAEIPEKAPLPVTDEGGAVSEVEAGQDPFADAETKQEGAAVSSEPRRARLPTQIIERARVVGAVDGDRVRVLVADDDVEFAALLAEILEQEGYSVTTVHDGSGAVQRALAEDYYIIFMDIMMPGVDGIKAIERIRSAEPGLLTVAVTGKAGPVDVARAMQAGAFQVLRKPIDTDELRARLAEWALIAKKRRFVTDRYAKVAPPASGFFSFAGKRKRVVILIVLLLFLTGLAVPAIHRAVSSALGAIGKGVGYLRSTMETVIRSEGYLQRDEQRELDRERKRGR